MYSIDSIIVGIVNYIDNNILVNIKGWQRIVYGVYIGRVGNNIKPIIEKYKDHDMVKMLNIIDNDGNVNLDELKEDIEKQLDKGDITIEVPKTDLVLTFKKSDVDIIYNYIRG